MGIRYTINRFIRDTITSQGRGTVLDNGEHGNREDESFRQHVNRRDSSRSFVHIKYRLIAIKCQLSPSFHTR